MSRIPVPPAAADTGRPALQRGVLTQARVTSSTEAAGGIDLLGETGRAREARFHHDTLAGANPPHLRPDLDDLADDLMAEIEATVAWERQRRRRRIGGAGG